MAIPSDVCITQLKGMFPDMSTDVLQLVLESNALNVDATVAALLAMQKESTPEISKMKLPKLYKSMCEKKMEMKVAAETQDFHTAAKRKDQISAIETAIQADLAQGHKVDEKDVEIRLGADGKAGFDFKYHGGGWDVTVIHKTPGQPDLQIGDRIIKIGGSDIREIKYEDQLSLWKKAAAETKKFSGTILRFTDASLAEKKKQAPSPAPQNSTVEGASTAPDLKRQQSDMKLVGETPDQEITRLVQQLMNGTVPDDFLRTPAYFQEHGHKKTQTQEEKDAALARLLQDKIFMEELRNNPDAFIDRRRSNHRTSNQHRARTQASLVQNSSTTSSNPTGPPPQADLSGVGSAPKKTTFSKRLAMLGDAAKERLSKMAEFFKRKKSSQRKTPGSPEAELVPLAEDADHLPLAPDLADEDGAFVIDSDEDLGVGAGDAEGAAMANLMKSMDPDGAVAVDILDDEKTVK